MPPVGTRVTCGGPAATVTRTGVGTTLGGVVVRLELVVGLALAEAAGLVVGLALGEALALVVGVADGVGGGPADVTTEFSAARQVTVAPPPLLLPLHWLMVTGSAAVSVEVSTVHSTRIVPPPPLPLPLHWSTAAAVTLPGGLHDTVG